MRFTTTQQDLNRGLSLASHAVAGKPTRPIEAYIRAEASGETQRVCFSARSEEMGIQCWIPASSIPESGVSLLPAQLFTDFVSNLRSVPVTVTSPSPRDPLSCQVQCSASLAQMKNGAQDVAEFPLIPSFAGGGDLILHLDAELLKQMIAQVAFAAADSDKDVHIAALTGVNLDIRNGKAEMAAADSFCLAVRSTLLPDDQQRQTLLLPAKAMEELARLLPTEGTVQVLLTRDRRQVVFHTTMMDVAIRLLNLTFPNLHTGAIPGDWTTRALLPTQELAALVRLMAPFARQARNCIRLKFSGEAPENRERESNTVTLSVVAQDVGDNHNVLGAQIEGPEQEIDLHVKYLAKVLSVITTPQVALEITNAQRPAVIKPVNGDDCMYVLMPINFGHAQASAQRVEPEPAMTA